MTRQNNGHVVLVPNRAYGANEASPFVVGGNPALAVGRRLDVLPVVLGAEMLNEQCLQCINCIDDQRSVFTWCGVELSKRSHNRVEAVDIVESIQGDAP